MRYQQFLQQIISPILVAAFLVGCIAPITTRKSEVSSATSTSGQPTATSIPATSNATPITLPSPKPGHWEGEGGIRLFYGEPDEFRFSKDPSLNATVSFDVTSEGNIRNFKGFFKFDPFSPCSFTIEEIPVEPDGTFELVESATNTGSGAVIEEAIHFNGKFDSSNTMAAALSLKVCGKVMYISSTGDPLAWAWVAAWKGP